MFHIASSGANPLDLQGVWKDFLSILNSSSSSAPGNSIVPATDTTPNNLPNSGNGLGLPNGTTGGGTGSSSGGTLSA